MVSKKKGKAESKKASKKIMIRSLVEKVMRGRLMEKHRLAQLQALAQLRQGEHEVLCKCTRFW